MEQTNETTQKIQQYMQNEYKTIEEKRKEINNQPTTTQAKYERQRYNLRYLEGRVRSLIEVALRIERNNRYIDEYETLGELQDKLHEQTLQVIERYYDHKRKEKENK